MTRSLDRCELPRSVARRRDLRPGGPRGPAGRPRFPPQTRTKVRRGPGQQVRSGSPCAHAPSESWPPQRGVRRWTDLGARRWSRCAAPDAPLPRATVAPPSGTRSHSRASRCTTRPAARVRHEPLSSAVPQRPAARCDPAVEHGTAISTTRSMALARALVWAGRAAPSSPMPRATLPTWPRRSDRRPSASLDPRALALRMGRAGATPSASAPRVDDARRAAARAERRGAALARAMRAERSRRRCSAVRRATLRARAR